MTLEANAKYYRYAIGEVIRPQAAPEGQSEYLILDISGRIVELLPLKLHDKSYKNRGKACNISVYEIFASRAVKVRDCTEAERILYGC